MKGYPKPWKRKKRDCGLLGQCACEMTHQGYCVVEPGEVADPVEPIEHGGPASQDAMHSSLTVSAEEAALQKNIHRSHSISFTRAQGIPK